MRSLFLGLLCSCAAAAPPVRFNPDALIVPAPPRPSVGCAAQVPAVQGDRTLTSGGRTRRFRLVVPESAGVGPSGRKPAPLVLNLHGLVETAQLQQTYSGMDAKAAARGMITVYPQGAGNSWNAGSCCGRAQAEGIDDVRFLRQLVGEIESELCIDRNRVYATGMSNGAMMSYRLACEASDLVAAVAPVDGVEALPRCTPRRPVPVLSLNGTSDILVRWESGRFGLGSALETAANLRRRNRCSAAVRVAYQHGDAICERALGCAAETISCRIEGGGHTWPGALPVPFLGHTSSDLDATATILDFFLDHPMEQASGPGPGASPKP